MAGNRKLSYLHQTLENLRVANDIMPSDLQGVGRLCYLLEAPRKSLTHANMMRKQQPGKPSAIPQTTRQPKK